MSSSILSYDEILKQNWSNRIPIRLTLASDNITSPASVRPIYLFAPRQGYLSSVAAQAWPQFQHVLPNHPGNRHSTQPWFDWNGVPLKWNFPVGVLYDLMIGSRPNGAVDLPWALTIHYVNFPEALLSWDNGLPLQAHFFTSLKEASHICRGSDGSGAVMRMNGATQDELWAAVQRGDCPSFSAVWATARVVPTERQGNAANIPVRLFLKSPPRVTDTGGAASMWSNVTPTSRPIPSTLPSGQPTTLADVLSIILPAIFPSSRSPTLTPPRPSPSGHSQPAPSAQPHQGACQPASPPASGPASPLPQTSPTLPLTHRPSRGLEPPSASASPDSSPLRATTVIATTSSAPVPVPSPPSAMTAAAAAAEASAEASASGSQPAAETSSSTADLQTDAALHQPCTDPPGAPLQVMQRGSQPSRSSGGAPCSTASAGALTSLCTSAPPSPHTSQQQQQGEQQQQAEQQAAQQQQQQQDPREPSPDTPPALGPSSPLPASSNPTATPADQDTRPTQRADDAGVQAGGAPADSSSPSCSQVLLSPPIGCRVVVAGISPPMDAPVAWLHSHLHAPDYFLYIIVWQDPCTVQSC
ncbi:MAG: hypothetical protein WDW36_001492 [Sanguina aurantia]